MKRVVMSELECRCRKISTALNRFFKKYPGLEYWREHLEWMAENGIDYDSDEWSDKKNRVCNDEWTWAIHLDIGFDTVYICIIERI